MKKKTEKNTFDSFQLEEYKNISVSHYESIKQISTFFQFYLLTLAAPAFILGLVTKEDDGLINFFAGNESSIYYNIVFVYFLTISMVGYFIYLYVINIRHDAILYAKSVNKVRRYFYENSNIPSDEYPYLSQLPLNASNPKYGEKTFFAPLILVFSFINGGMFASAFAFKLLKEKYFFNVDYGIDLPITYWLIFILTFIFVIIHTLSYKYLSYRRNNFYLKSYIIGIDIDGVLNNQTKHFLDFLEIYTHKRLDINKLLEIPVHLNQELDISDYEERLIFNTKEYWETLPIKENSIKRVNELQKRFGMKIIFFSYRDWPQYGNDEKEMKDAIIKKGYTPLEKKQIIKITENWLNINSLNAKVVTNFCDKIIFFFLNLFKDNKSVIIELGNPYISDNRYFNKLRKAILNNNRFQGANLIGFKFFIEDSPESAIRLANLCDYVFLFDEPYNKSENYSFPKNVIRVYCWDDVFRNLKKLS